MDYPAVFQVKRDLAFKSKFDLKTLLTQICD